MSCPRPTTVWKTLKRLDTSETMKYINIQNCKTKIGELILGSFEGKLCLLDFRYRKMRKSVDERIKKGLNAKFIENNPEIIEKTRAELDE